ncbi:hypothetical protein HOO34_01030 [Aliarcobacter cryaerophilus]|uniref:DUF4878 domain-containing protein n=1 Tax=Aliarcobacter cryaerophilus TaxID=28198 RepID=A0A7G9LP06_9BACT|nr:hypothetical protein [Aliarcobacter cryaerophilus]QNM90355.1 hypothetical protein HOO34_01030 [Aliarcobacter cryaerophilus]
MKKLFLALMLVLGFSLNVYASNNTPESVITSFLEAMRNGDEAKARTYLDLNSFIVPKNIMKPQLGNKDISTGKIGLVKNMFVQNGNSGWTYTIKLNDNRLVNPDSRGVYAYIVKMETTNYDLTKYYEVKKINNTWKITGWI